MPTQDKVAFRCKNCGHLEAAEHAGENAVPHACSVCGKGVRFNEQGIKFAVPENWEVLADAAPERLQALGVKPEAVVKHVSQKLASAAEIVGAMIERTATESLGAKDKATT